MIKKLATVAVVFGLVSGMLTGCGSGNTMYTADKAVTEEISYDNGVAGNSYAAEMADDTSADNQTQNIDSMTLLEEKLVYHCDLNIETLDYPSAISSIKETISKYNGVIQSESETDSSYDWYYEGYRKTKGTMRNYLEVRIPSEKYNDFLSELDGVGKIISKSTSVDNISQQYYDTTTQIEALKIQEKNLLSMLEKCEAIEDMLTIEKRLSEVQYELNSLQTNKRYMDIDVAYSYVNINISEVMEYREDIQPEKTNKFADRLLNTIKTAYKGFLRFLEGLLFFVIFISPYLIIAAIVCFIFRKKIKKFMADKKAEKAARRAQEEMRKAAIMQQSQQMKYKKEIQQQQQDKEQNNK